MLKCTEAANSKNQQTAPDYVKHPKHVWSALSNRTWEQELFLTLNQVSLHLYVVRVRKLRQDHPKEEAAESKAANYDTTDKPDSFLQVRPSSLKRCRIHQTFADTKSTAIAIDESCWACDVAAQVYYA